MNAYNPFRAAAEAAFAEITSEQAKQFYALKAQKDFQNALDGAITVCAWAYQLAQMTYMMGVQCRAWCDELEREARTCDRIPPLLPPAKITPLTPPTDIGKSLLGEAIRTGLKLRWIYWSPGKQAREGLLCWGKETNGVVPWSVDQPKHYFRPTK